MERQAYLSFLLTSIVDGFYFPNTLVHSQGQAKSADDLVGMTIPVATQTALNEHFNELAATPTFTQHMNVFEGEDAMRSMTKKLGKEFGLTMSPDEVFACAQDPNCHEVWTTASAFSGKTIRITDVIGSWNMSETGVGNACHVNVDKDHALCHIPSDVYKTGIAWMAVGNLLDAPEEKSLPVAVRCHDMGLSMQDMEEHDMVSSSCHLLSGNEFMAARPERISRESQHKAGLTALGGEPRVHVDPLHYGQYKGRRRRTTAPPPCKCSIGLYKTKLEHRRRCTQTKKMWWQPLPDCSMASQEQEVYDIEVEDFDEVEGLDDAPNEIAEVV